MAPNSTRRSSLPPLSPAEFESGELCLHLPMNLKHTGDVPQVEVRLLIGRAAVTYSSLTSMNSDPEEAVVSCLLIRAFDFITQWHHCLGLKSSPAAGHASSAD